MKLSKLISYSVVLVSISSVLAWCDLPIGNTFVWWLFESLVLIIFFLVANKGKYDNKLINFFLIIVVFSFIYGFFTQVQNYWDCKMMVSNLMIFLLPIATYTFRQPALFSQVLRFWFVVGPVLLLFLSPFLHSDAYGKLLVPFSVFALWMNEVPRKFQLLILGAFIICVTLGNQARGDMLKFFYCIFLGGLSMIPFLRRIFDKCIRGLWLLQIVIPFILFALAISGSFNIFAIQSELDFDDYEISNTKEKEKYNGLADTRSLLYIEEFISAVNNHYIVMGRSLARGYDSESFGDQIDGELNISRGERGSCEVSILNIFNYFGLVGVLVYALLFWISSYKAIFISRNRFMPLLGLYISFRWCYAFVEDFTKFDLNYLLLWIMIGMCFSIKYRRMNNCGFKFFINRCIPIK